MREKMPSVDDQLLLAPSQLVPQTKPQTSQLVPKRNTKQDNWSHKQNPKQVNWPQKETTNNSTGLKNEPQTINEDSD